MTNELLSKILRFIEDIQDLPDDLLDTKINLTKELLLYKKSGGTIIDIIKCTFCGAERHLHKGVLTAEAYEQVLYQVERRLLLIALAENNDNRSKTATVLNMDRKTIYNKMHRLGILENQYMPVHPDSLKQFPDCPEQIPLRMLNEEWALTNHGSSLRTLASGPGLHIISILDNIFERELSYRTDSQEDVDTLKELLSIF